MTSLLRRNLPTLIILALVLLTGLLCHALAPASAAPRAALGDDLISCWDMDEASGVRYDEAGLSGNDLTDNNTVGTINGHADFEAASSEYLSRASNSTLQTGDIDWSLLAWLDVESFSQDRYMGSKGTDEYEIELDSSGKVIFKVWDGSALDSVQSTASLSLETTYMVAVGRTAADEIWVSVNAATPDTGAVSGANAGTNPFYLGANPALSRTHDGEMWRVGFWKRDIRADLSALYNGGSGLSCAELTAEEPTPTNTLTPTETLTPTATNTGEPTATNLPTATGVPLYVIQSTLPSGEEFIVERSASFGQMVNALLLVVVIGLVFMGLVLRLFI